MTNINLTTQVQRTARVAQLEGIFDLETEQHSATTIPLNISNTQLEQKNWNIGLIVGPSGAGKTTVAKHLFGELVDNNHTWSNDKAIIDDFPQHMKMTEITELLSSVGLSSPPTWLRPYDKLSNGEQFRVTLARTLAEQHDVAVIDEFTSVVDRTVAKVGSSAIAKTVRRQNKKLVAVSCHFDIEEWLQPDWVYQPHTGEFTWGHLQQRPPVEVTIVPTTTAAWAYFSRHHYLDSNINKACKTVVALIENEPAAIVAVLPMPSGTVRNAFRVSRIVVTPDYQGIGIGKAMLDIVGGAHKHQNKRLYITSSHPSMIHGLNRSSTWRMNGKPKRNGKNTNVKMNKTTALTRLVGSFEYVGPPDPSIANMFGKTRYANSRRV